MERETAIQRIKSVLQEFAIPKVNGMSSYELARMCWVACQDQEDKQWLELHSYTNENGEVEL